MSSESIAIPKRRQPLDVAGDGSGLTSDSASSPSSFESPRTPMRSSKGKQRAVESPLSPTPEPREYLSARRPSLLGTSLSKSEYTVIDLSASETAAPRLVTCVKSSQGFDWNQELFLPSHAKHDSHDLEHRPDPVEDIILTDEEAAALMPQ